MADRYRDQPYQDEDHGRDPYAAPQRPAESDPLAELARLIGQTDPFSSFGRDNQRPADNYDEFEQRGGSIYDEEPASQPAWLRNVRPSQEAAYGDEQYEEPRFDDRRNGHAHGYDDGNSFAPNGGGRAADTARYDDVLFGEPERERRSEAPFPPSRDRYSDDRFGEPRYEEEYDEEPPRRRGGMLSVVVVMLLAVVGTAAAFGYRTYIGSPRSGDPPIIKADAGPNKVMASSGDKPISDRVGDKSAERVVSREEQPVDVNGKTQPRVVFPPLTQNANPPNAASANVATRPTGAGVGNGTVSTGGEEPRKIRTLTIRPDQSTDATASADTSSVPPPAPRAPTPSVAPRVSQTAPASTGNGPMALTPQSAPAAESRTRVSSISSSSGGASGSYVQVSSQKTEADAQTSFRAIQSKYPDVLGSKSATIRRADLGDKGVFYRALVGPFGTTDEATQFCVNLKAAGGSCLVQR